MIVLCVLTSLRVNLVIKYTEVKIDTITTKEIAPTSAKYPPRLSLSVNIAIIIIKINRKKAALSNLKLFRSENFLKFP